MKLLFVTRKIDKHDPRVGFVLDWVNELAKNLDKLYIITWQKSNGEGLVENIELITFGGNKFVRLIKFKWQLFKTIPKVDGVFTHMMPQYAIMAGWFVKIFKKKIYHWYTHKSVDLKLKIANLFVDGFISASKKSFRMKTRKPVYVWGHGIRKIKNKKLKIKIKDDIFKIITIGRISPTKDYESMIKAVNDLENKNVKLDIIGEPTNKRDQGYLDILKSIVKNFKLENQIKFIGAVKYEKISEYLSEADLFLNLSSTGSVDKAVLEAMGAGVIVLTSNEAFQEILPNELMTEKDNPEVLKEKIKMIMDLSEEERGNLILKLQKEVEEKHSLEKLMRKIVGLYEKV